MKHCKHFTKVLVILAAVTLGFPGICHAYLDPGTGSLVLQILLATTISAFFFAKRFWGKCALVIRRFLGRQEG